MKNANQPHKRQAPNGDPSAAKAQPSGPERQKAEQSKRSQTTGSKKQPVDRAGLSDELEDYRTQLRDYEKVLVERIADVDDDFRTTTSRLQRVQQTQHDALDKRLQRHARLLGGLMLFAVLFAIALFLVYRQLALESSRVATEVSEIHQGLASLSEGQRSQGQVRERPDQVTTQVAEVRAASEGPDKGEEPAAQASFATERTPGEQAEGRLAVETRRPDAARRDRAQDSATPQLTDAGPATPKVAAQVAEVRAASEGPDKDEKPAAQASFATERTPGEQAEGRLAVETRRSDAARRDRAQDPAAPRFADAGPVTPKVAAMSTTDGADGTENAGSAPEKPEGSPPAMETLGVKRPEAIGSNLSVAAGTDASASDLGQTHVVSENGYGLQLIGFFNHRTLDKFAARKGLPARVYVIRETYRGRSWHTIIHSLHPDYDAAKEELSRLPADLVALKPWIRALQKGAKLQVIETGLESSAATPEVAPTSTPDVSDGTENAGNGEESSPLVEAAKVKSPGAMGSDVPAAAETDAGASGLEKTHVVSAGGYGLQLIGFFNRRALDRFTAQKGLLPARVYVIRETHQRRPWHSIIHSLHPDSAAAKEELSRLPPDLAALKPLVRPLRVGTKLQVVETGVE
ncbi:SPOR domain-containing protein [Candidatus Thiosymbion oneisti]|uniref:SPOR domain-containing protein n=1 Tax=Candidatus Thiosymbion oneisti TaxID=589554 RepID=UPI000B0A9BA9|nr:hypothetical protein [Candidatus Thiosymbion oneisti]